jgi:predicted permease
MGWTRFFRRSRWDEERARELEAYLQEEIDENIGRGMDPDAARMAAHRKLGNVTRIREDIYEMNTIEFLDTIWQDLRYAARVLRRNRTFAVVAILTLALGTGANAAIFQLVEAVRLRTLPVQNPQELAEVRIDSRGKGRTGRSTGRRPQLTNGLWEQIRDRQQAFSSIMAWGPRVFDLAAGGEVRPAQGLWVSGSFFSTLGVRPALGRLIQPDDDVRGCSGPGVVLSHAFWRRQYGSNPSVVGQTILLDGHRFDIIGVAREGFFGVEVGRSFDVAVPLCSEPLFNGAQSALDKPDWWFLASFGRLKAGWSLEEARSHLRGISPAIFKETVPPSYVAEDANDYLNFLFDATTAGTGVSSLRTTYSTPLWILLGVTGLVLLITCANLANLMLARAAARGREIGVRLAIGASRRRLVRQMLSESLLLAILGAAVGLLLARWLSGFLVAFLSSENAPLFLDLDFNWRVFAFAALVACTACLLFGLAPALRSTAAATGAAALGLRSAGDGAARFTLRRALVVAQVALSLVLVAVALLFGLSLRNLILLDPGFRNDGVLIVNLDFRRANIAPQALRPLFTSIVEQVATVPGVDGAAEAFIAPMSGSGWNNRIIIDGKVQEGLVNFNAVSPGYFGVLGTRMIGGRDFAAHDGPSSRTVAIVNELFVKKYLADGALGRRFQVQEGPGANTHPTYEIIGVVANTKYTDLREELPPIAYLASAQQKEDEPYLQLVAHSTVPPSTLIPAVSHVIETLNPAISMQFNTLDRLTHRSLTTERLMATLSGFFGGLAALIATIGLYGVISYIVARRRTEIGIRMALGADAREIVRMVLSDAARLLAVGLGLGAALAIVAGMAASSLLYGLKPWDPATLALAAAGLGVIALFASWLPAHRASRVSPTVALRQD